MRRIYRDAAPVSAPALKHPLRGAFSMPSQKFQGLAVKLVTVEVLELAVGARRIEYPECAVEIPERPPPAMPLAHHERVFKPCKICRVRHVALMTAEFARKDESPVVDR